MSLYVDQQNQVRCNRFNECFKNLVEVRPGDNQKRDQRHGQVNGGDQEVPERRVRIVQTNGKHGDVGADGDDATQSLTLDHGAHVGRRKATRDPHQASLK